MPSRLHLEPRPWAPTLQPMKLRLILLASSLFVSVALAQATPPAPATPPNPIIATTDKGVPATAPKPQAWLDVEKERDSLKAELTSTQQQLAEANARVAMLTQQRNSLWSQVADAEIAKLVPALIQQQRQAEAVKK